VFLLEVGVEEGGVVALMREKEAVRIEAVKPQVDMVGLMGMLGMRGTMDIKMKNKIIITILHIAITIMIHIKTKDKIVMIIRGAQIGDEVTIVGTEPESKTTGINTIEGITEMIGTIKQDKVKQGKIHIAGNKEGEETQAIMDMVNIINQEEEGIKIDNECFKQ